VNVLVTGGAGFIGSHIVERLVAEHSRAGAVRVVDNLSTGKMENLRPFLDRIEFIQGDLAEQETCAQAVRDIEVVFHEAAVPSVPRSVADPVESHRHGAHATLLLLEACRRHKVRRLVYAASSSAYGDSPALPKREDMAPAPLSPYAASKLAGEYYCKVFTHCYGLDTVALRYFNVFGPRQDPASPYSGVIAKFCTAFVGDEPLVIYGDGEQSRDFTYVADTVEANLAAARRAAPLKGMVLNVASGERHTLNQLAALLKRLTGKQRAVRHAEARPGDVRHSLADLTRVRAELGFEPKVDFRTGLARTLEWYSAGGR
jgi:nucleoside-diphosphate-sugar epimerase